MKACGSKFADTCHLKHADHQKYMYAGSSSSAGCWGVADILLQNSCHVMNFNLVGKKEGKKQAQ